MCVYFVYRSHYEGPSGKHVRVLQADSVLGWFRDVWERAKGAEDAGAWLKAELGCEVYGLSSIVEAAREESLPPPTSDRQLKSYLEEHLYVEGEMRYKPHALQVLTDDDEIELAYYVFDDHYVRQHPGKADYLLHEGWKLPITSGDGPYEPGIRTKGVRPSGAGPGTTYLAFLAFYDSGGLSVLDDFGGPCRIKGVRVPQLADYLEVTVPDEAWPFELKVLRSQSHSDDLTEGRLGAALGRVARLPVIRMGGTGFGAGMGLATVEQARTQLEEEVKALGGVPDHDASKSLVGTSDHLAQLCLHVGNWFGRDVYHQWVIFDDLWAGGHRDLADGVLRYAKRWDVLTT
jgi:hypothetical protein